MDDYVKEVIIISERDMNETLMYDILMRKAKVKLINLRKCCSNMDVDEMD